jgi:hypothetical protein
MLLGESLLSTVTHTKHKHIAWASAEFLILKDWCD